MNVIRRLGTAVALTGLYILASYSFQYTFGGTSCLMASVSVLVFGVFILTRNPSDHLIRSFFYLSLSLPTYLFVVFLLYMAYYVGIDFVEPYARVFRNGSLLIPPLIIYFTFNLAVGRGRICNVFTLLALLSVLPFVVLNISGNYIVSYTQLTNKFVPNENRWMYQVYALVTVFWIFFSIAVVVVQYFREKHRRKKKQLGLYLVAIMAFSVPGLLGFVPAYGVKWFPSFIGIGATLFVVILGISVIRYSLFDINVVIRRTLPYALGTALIGVAYSLILHGINDLNRYFQIHSGESNWVILLILMGVGFEPVLEDLKKGLDRIFFRTEARIDRFLAYAAERYMTASSSQELCEMAARDIGEMICPEGVVVSIHDPERCAVSVVPGEKNVSNDWCRGNCAITAHSAGLVEEDDDSFSSYLNSFPRLKGWRPRLILVFGESSIKGVIACREKRSHLSFYSRDHVFLKALSRQLEMSYSRISANRQAESDRRLLGAVFESMLNPVVVANDNGLILACNPAFASAFNLTVGQFISFVSFPFLRNVDAGIDSEEFNYNGRVWVVSSRRAEDSNESRIVAVLTDVTELRKLNDENRSRKALAEIGATVSSINHEVRNILSPMGFYLKQIEDALPENESAIVNLRSRLNMLEKFARELREFYKEPVLELRNVRLGTIVDSVLADVSAIAGDDWQGPETSEFDYRISADPQKCKQVLLNILKNAWDAMAEKDTKNWSIVITDKGENVSIKVQDSGYGIPEQLQGRVFEPFFSTKRDKGTGLGLAIARRIVEAHKGTIGMSSSQSGTEVNILWPKAAL